MLKKLLAMFLLCGCQEANYIAGELDINNSCTPRSGTFVIQYEKLSGNCEDRQEEVKKFDESSINMDDFEVSNDLCNINGQMINGIETQHLDINFNEDWSYGDGVVNISTPSCYSSYYTTVRYLVW